MFIYKIIVNNNVYIGLDTKPSYKLSRWKKHCDEATTRCKTKLHKAMNMYGIKNCVVEILKDNFKSIGELALSEIDYIKQYDSYKNGLNSTPGGDGLGKYDLTLLSLADINKIKSALGEHFSNYNKNIKWAGTTEVDRKLLTKHLHTDEIYQKKSDTLKKFYKANPDIAKTKAVGIRKWQLENPEEMKKRNQINSIKGAAAVSKKLKVELEDGNVLYYSSKSEFHRLTNQWANTIIKKTQEGVFYNGYKIWEEK
jgi:hypothetical protein